MRQWIMDVICCPDCGGQFVLKQIESDADHTETGFLYCKNHHWFPIIRKIPRLLGEKFRIKLTEEFVEKYRDLLSTSALIKVDTKINDLPDLLHDLKKKTIQNFGFEWLEYSRFGWDDEHYNLETEKKVFSRKSLLSIDELNGKTVLDAGCGNGRYCYWAATHGARVVGIDLGDGVESALKNTCDYENINIIQGDIFNLPFKNESFDAVFSIGVLMHTGNARKATETLSRKVRNNGILTVHLYGKGNLIYECIDCMLRLFSRRLSIKGLQKMTAFLFWIRKLLDRLKLSGIVNRYVRIDPHPHCIFDWYAAPVASHHTYKEVIKWFGAMDFKVVSTNENPTKSFIKKVLRPFAGAPATVTVKGIKSR